MERCFAMAARELTFRREEHMAIEIQGMAPLLQVFDMPTSVKFYRDVLGFEVESTSKPRGGHFDWALLKLNGVELMLNTAYEQARRAESGASARLSAHDDTAIYFGCPEVDGA
jgi:catechol 2,3-dioxygenase-like lactoylglutathione lyase family enzyme